MGEPLILQLFVASSIPVVKILLICGIGAFCARKGLLTPEGRRVLGALSFLVFNPSLIFVKLASTLTPDRLVHWWPLLMNTAISTAVGLGLGYLGVRLVRPVHYLRPHTIVAIALGNLGNLPLVIVSTLATSSAAVLHGIPPERAEDLAVSYVVVGLLVPVIVHATIGFSMLRKPNTALLPEPADLVCEDGELQTPRTAAIAAVVAAADAAAAAAAEAAADDGDGAGARSETKLGPEGQTQHEHQKQPLLADEWGQSRHRSIGGAAAAVLTSARRSSGWHRLSSSGRPKGCGGEPQDEVPLLLLRRGRKSGDGGLAAAGADSASAGVAAAGADSASAGVVAACAPERRSRWTSGIEAWEQEEAPQPHGKAPLAPQPPQQAQVLPRRSSLGAFEGRDRTYGCAVDCLGQDGDPLLVQQPGPAPAAEREVVVEKGHSVVELPHLAGARLMPGRSGSSADLLRSASGKRTVARLTRSGSGRRLLLEWHSRIDYRALGRQVGREATSPPLLAILLSVPVGCVRPLQQAFFGGPGAPLALVTGCLSMLGDCTVPSILLILGATLANGPGAAPVPLRLITLVNATRLVLLPLLGLGLVMGAYAAHMFEAPDPIYLLVLLIQNTAPTAIMVHTMASVHSNRAEEVSTILFWGYIAGIVAIPLWLTLFLFVVKEQFRDGGAAGGQ